MDTDRELLRVFDRVTGDLREVASPWDDFWGTVVGFHLDPAREIEDEETHTTRIVRSMVVDIRTDTGRDETESYGLPTDAQGNPSRDADGKLVRPSTISKWGRQEQILEAIGVNWGQLEDLVGLHAHFERKPYGRADRRNVVKAGEEPRRGFTADGRRTGRFITDQDGFNIDVRKSLGLTGTPVVAMPRPIAVEAVEVVNHNGSELEAVNLLTQLGGWIPYTQAITTTHQDLAVYNTRAVVQDWITRGIVDLDREGKFHVGELYQDWVAMIDTSTIAF